MGFVRPRCWVRNVGREWDVVAESEGRRWTWEGQGRAVDVGVEPPY